MKTTRPSSVFGEIPLLRLGRSYAMPSERDLWTGWRVTARFLRRRLSVAMLQELSRIARGEADAVLVNGLPTDPEVDPTPLNGRFSERQLVAGDMLGTLVVLAGYTPVAYRDENEGRLIRHVVPHKAHGDQVGSHGSRHSFPPHADNPNYLIRGEEQENRGAAPDLLAFTSLRSDPSVPLHLRSLDDVLARLKRRTIRTLLKPEFTVLPPSSFDEKGHRWPNRPILGWDGESYVHRFDRIHVVGQTRRARKALSEMAEAVDETPPQQLVLRPGEAVLFDNQRTLHSRPGFSPGLKGMDRWLIRVYGVKERWRIKSSDESQPWVIDSPR